MQYEGTLPWIRNHISNSPWEFHWLLTGVVLTLLLSIKFIEIPFKKLMDNKMKA